MTVGQRIFYLLEKNNMTQVEFSKRTGIATTTISDWRKKNTNPGSEKIMAICAALDVTPEYLLSGVCEDSVRGKDVDYLIIPKGTDERILLELFSDMPWLERAHLLEYAKKMIQRNKDSTYVQQKNCSMHKIAEFCDIEVYMNDTFSGTPSVDINYLDDDVHGQIDLTTGKITGNFSKYVLPVIEAWLKEHIDHLLRMWQDHIIEILPAWD